MQGLGVSSHTSGVMSPLSHFLYLISLPDAGRDLRVIHFFPISLACHSTNSGLGLSSPAAF